MNHTTTHDTTSHDRTVSLVTPLLESEIHIHRVDSYIHRVGYGRGSSTVRRGFDGMVREVVS